MGFFTKDKQINLNWIKLESVEELMDIWNEDSGKIKLFFKHSTRCGTSSFALSRFEKEWDLAEEECQIYFCDLIAHRSISNKLEELSQVIHQSPQVILIKGQEVIHTASHSGIDALQIQNIISQKS